MKKETTEEHLIKYGHLKSKEGCKKMKCKSLMNKDNNEIIGKLRTAFKITGIDKTAIELLLEDFLEALEAKDQQHKEEGEKEYDKGYDEAMKYVKDIDKEEARRNKKLKEVVETNIECAGCNKKLIYMEGKCKCHIPQ